MRHAISTLVVLLVVVASVAASALEIEKPDGGEPVPVPFVVEGSAEPGSVLVLEVDGTFVTLFRADSDGRFSVPVARSASLVTVRSESDDAISDSVSIITEGEFEPKVTREETAVGTKATPEEAAPDPEDPDALTDVPVDDSTAPDTPATGPEVPPTPEELERSLEGETAETEDGDEWEDEEEFDEPGFGQDQRPDLPDGYTERCHYRPLKAPLHCHIVPIGSSPSYEPFRFGPMVLQFLGSWVGAIVGAAAGGGLGYVMGLTVTGDPFLAEPYALIGFIVGLYPGMAFGAWGTGQLLGGKGSFLWTMGGTLLLGAVGSVLGYNLSADEVYDDELEQYEQFAGRSEAVRQYGVPLVLVRF